MKKELISEIENRFHLLITLSIFFPVLLADLYRAIGYSEVKIRSFLLETSALVGLYILVYVLFQVDKNLLEMKYLKRLNKGLLIGLSLFIVPILGIALTPITLPDWLGMPIAFISSTAILLVFIFPIIIEVIIILFGVSQMRGLNKKADAGERSYL